MKKNRFLNVVCSFKLQIKTLSFSYTRRFKDSIFFTSEKTVGEESIPKKASKMISNTATNMSNQKMDQSVDDETATNKYANTGNNTLANAIESKKEGVYDGHSDEPSDQGDVTSGISTGDQVPGTAERLQPIGASDASIIIEDQELGNICRAWEYAYMIGGMEQPPKFGRKVW